MESLILIILFASLGALMDICRRLQRIIDLKQMEADIALEARYERDFPDQHP
jgi:hypothetical protein